MVQVKVKQTSNTITNRLNKIRKDISNIPKEAYNVVLENTAVRSGNARRNTKRSGERINANYPYAVKLNEGHSKQFPDGFVKPMEEFVAKRLEQIAKG